MFILQKYSSSFVIFHILLNLFSINLFEDHLFMRFIRKYSTTFFSRYIFEDDQLHKKNVTDKMSQLRKRFQSNNAQTANNIRLCAFCLFGLHEKNKQMP
jgi:hypothetical protein